MEISQVDGNLPGLFETVSRVSQLYQSRMDFEQG